MLFQNVNKMKAYALRRAPHYTFPLQGLSSPIGAEPVSSLNIAAYEPVGEWHDLLLGYPSLGDLYQAFEKLWLCKTVIVLAKTPDQCSKVVSALLDVIKPMPYGGITRPYLTMQSEFFAGPKDAAMPKHFLIGLTNPFLLQRIVTSVEANGHETPLIINMRQDSMPPPVKLHHSISRSHKQEIDIPGGFEAKAHSKKHIKSDREFIAQLQALFEDVAAVPTIADHLVRRHFSDLTAQLLSPLGRYFATHLECSVTSPEGYVQYANFNTEDFLKSLGRHGSTIKWRGQSPMQRHKVRDDFYRIFTESPNFFAWLDLQYTLDRQAKAGFLSDRV